MTQSDVQVTVTGFMGWMARIVVSALIGCVIVSLSYYWANGGAVPGEARYLTYGFYVAAFAILFARGGNDLTPALWILILQTYPVLAPALSMDLFGTERFAARLREFQTPGHMVVPMLIGSLTAVLFAINLSVQSLRLPGRQTRVETSGAWRTRTVAIVFFGSLVLLFIANWLDAQPKSLGLGQIVYRDIKAARNDHLNISAALVVIFAAIAILSASLLFRDDGVARATKRRLAWLLGVSILIIVVWQILSASRVEACAMLFLCLMLFGHRIAIALRFAAIGAISVIFALVGYVRMLHPADVYLNRDFISWPGGVENAFKTYVYGLNAIKSGEIPIQYGTTYVDFLVRLPPKFFGLERPPRAYDLLSERTRLVGGEFFLTEPFLNFLGLGVFVFSLIIIGLMNAAQRQINAFWTNTGQFYATLVSTVFLMSSFRLIWYPLDNALKTVIAAAIIALPLIVFSVIERTRTTHSDVPRTP